jgi:branched-chain amino acid transport system substrate-binding protein
MVHDLYFVHVKKPAEIRQTWDYYDVKEIVGGDEAFQPLVILSAMFGSDFR